MFISLLFSCAHPKQQSRYCFFFSMFLSAVRVVAGTGVLASNRQRMDVLFFQGVGEFLREKKGGVKEKSLGGVEVGTKKRMRAVLH